MSGVLSSSSIQHTGRGLTVAQAKQNNSARGVHQILREHKISSDFDHRNHNELKLVG